MVALLSPALLKLMFWEANQGPLPSVVETVRVPVSPACGALRNASKTSTTLPLLRCCWCTVASAAESQMLFKELHYDCIEDILRSLHAWGCCPPQWAASERY
jgi:hypothetical protein